LFMKMPSSVDAGRLQGAKMISSVFGKTQVLLRAGKHAVEGGIGEIERDRERGRSSLKRGEDG
jgi:hypothetical protein